MQRSAEQEIAVTNIKGNMVVSASAGSGKTKTMIDRIINIIKNGGSVKRLLVATFTVKATQEIKDRLYKAICDEIKNCNDDDEIKRLKGQLDDLACAQISTVDSFFASLLRKYFYIFDVDPKFSIITDADLLTMRDTVLDRVFEKLYEQNQLDDLLKYFINKRKDDKLRDIIKTLYSYTESKIEGMSFLTNSLANYTLEVTKIFERQIIDDEIYKISQAYTELYELSGDAVTYNLDKYIKYFNGLCELEDRLEHADNFADIIETINIIKESDNFRKTTKTDAPSYAWEDAVATKKKAYNSALDNCKKLLESFGKDYIDYNVKVGEIAKKLVDVVNEFYIAYTEEKKENNVCDYTDISRYALKLLDDSEICKEIAESYDYILVDEYQDINELQDSIFVKLSRNNLFIVGDVKQGIYGFRGCDHTIFLRHIKACKNGEGQYVPFKKNFRCAENIVKAVNNTFNGVMTGDIGNYKEEQMEYGGLYFDGEKSYSGEANILNVNYIKEEEEEAKPYQEVYSVEGGLLLGKKEGEYGEEYAICNLIRELTDTPHYYFDALNTKSLKKIEYGDIAVLVRKNKKLLEKVIKLLAKMGISTNASSRESIGEFSEITFIKNIMQCIYYEEDISLAVTLKSPICGLNDKDLLAITNKYDNHNTFVERVKLALDDESFYLQKRLKEFYEYLDKIRLLSKFVGVSELVKQIMIEKDFYSYFLSQPNGKNKLSRIERLLAEGNSKNLKLYDFLNSFDNIVDSVTISPAGDDNSVKVMTMHASKGLEFPVVILSELDSDFNYQDKKEDIVSQKDVGFGLKYNDYDKKRKYKTLAYHQVLQQKIKDNMIEASHLLYVGMTRAKYNLYIISKKGIGLRDVDKCTLKDYIDKDDCPIKEMEINPIYFTEQNTRQDIILPAVDEGVKGEMSKYLGYQYPYEKDITLSLKRSVTSVNKVFGEEESVKPVFDDIPFDMDEGGNNFAHTKTSTDLGTKYHKFMELVDFDSDFDSEVERLKGLIDNIDEIDLIKMEKVFNNPLIKGLKGFTLHKEQPFIVRVSPQMVGEIGEEDLLLQGTIDLVAIKDDEAIIIDYKFSNSGKESLKNRYFKQLELYAYATTKSTDVKYIKKYILNLNSGEIIPL